jgi:xanthine/uracil/vitamin C permease (AzgA family)
VLRNVQVIGEKLLYNLPKSATAPALIFINLMLAQQLFVKEKKK